MIESKRNDEIDSKQNKMNVVLAAQNGRPLHLRMLLKDIKNALIGKSDQSDESIEERSDRLHNVMTARIKHQLRRAHSLYQGSWKYKEV